MNPRAAFVIGALIGYMVLPKVMMELSGILSRRK